MERWAVAACELREGGVKNHATNWVTKPSAELVPPSLLALQAGTLTQSSHR